MGKDMAGMAKRREHARLVSSFFVLASSPLVVIQSVCFATKLSTVCMSDNGMFLFSHIYKVTPSLSVLACMLTSTLLWSISYNNNNDCNRISFTHLSFNKFCIKLYEQEIQSLSTSTSTAKSSPHGQILERSLMAVQGTLEMVQPKMESWEASICVWNEMRMRVHAEPGPRRRIGSRSALVAREPLLD